MDKKSEKQDKLEKVAPGSPGANEQTHKVLDSWAYGILVFPMKPCFTEG